MSVGPKRLEKSQTGTMSTHQQGRGSRTGEFAKLSAEFEKFLLARPIRATRRRSLPLYQKAAAPVPVKRRGQKLPKLMRDWNRVGLHPGGQTPEILPMKAGKSISKVIMNARNMLRGESKIKAGSCRK